jgi:hypothetical protein
VNTIKVFVYYHSLRLRFRLVNTSKDFCLLPTLLPFASLALQACELQIYIISHAPFYLPKTEQQGYYCYDKSTRPHQEAFS